MSWQETYKKKLLSVEDAAAKIESGDHCFIDSSATSPTQLLNAIADRYESLKDVHFFGGLGMKPLKVMMSSQYVGHIDYHTYFYGPADRALAGKGNIDLDVVKLSDLARLFTDKSEDGPKMNTVILSVTPPDEHGNMNFGNMGVFAMGLMCRTARKVIAQVDKNLPAVAGEENQINVNDVTWICEHNNPPFVYEQPPITEVEQKIAEHILPFITDGSTLQIGLGGLSNAVGYGLESRKNLSVHTEMFTDSMVALVKKGVINGKILCAFALGNEELNEFICEGKVNFAPIWKVNNPYEIGKNDNFVSINACLMSDLTGQVSSEGIGHRVYSGIGGQVDYVRGAALSKGGKSFLCMPSTSMTKEGQLRSNIVLNFPPGQVVTTQRTDVMYIVTEHGVADLLNKSVEARVKAMIEIAHPDFRDELRESANEAGLIK